MKARNILKGCMFSLLSLSMLIVALIITTFIVTIASSYDFVESPVLFSIVYWLLPILFIVVLCYLVFGFCKMSLNCFAREVSSNMNNSSEKSKESTIPKEIKGWNWGAFVFNWIWGIRFRTYRAFWVFVPFVNMIMPFVLGVKGNEWAWKHNQWESIEDFKRAQRRWSRVAVGLLVGTILFAIVFIMQANKSFEESGSTKLALTMIEQSESFKSNIGIPYDLDLNRGTITGYEVSGSSDMNFDIEGELGEGVLEFKAMMSDRVWSITCLKITYLPSQEVEVFVPCDSGT